MWEERGADYDRLQKKYEEAEAARQEKARQRREMEAAQVMNFLTFGSRLRFVGGAGSGAGSAFSGWSHRLCCCIKVPPPRSFILSSTRAHPNISWHWSWLYPPSTEATPK